MVGQPRPERRVSSRMRSAPPPYMGARTMTRASQVTGKSPRRNSATRGAMKKSVTAARMERCGWDMESLSGATEIQANVCRKGKFRLGRIEFVQGSKARKMRAHFVADCPPQEFCY